MFQFEIFWMMNQLQLNMESNSGYFFILDASQGSKRDLRGDELRAKLKSF
jgi:hypothetical protein